METMRYNRRQFSRIKFPRPVLLDFGEKKYECSATNFSLGGMYVQGWFEQQPGDICDIKLCISETDLEMSIEAVCSVVRQDNDGLALRFTSMEPDGFLFLQEALLYRNNAHWCKQPNKTNPPVYSWKII
ncbi:PilZ domain-containing protein [Desulfobulbus sp. US1]|nr:PilZ domain-containing protein [Desulfobulbus sp. US1]